MNWIIISFYTIGTGYEQEVKKLEASLNKFNLPYQIFSYMPIGSWRANLNYKSETILKAFDLYPDKDIVFIDADGIVRRYPSLFDKLSEEKTYDIAAHFHPYHGNPIAGGSLLSGTLWIQNNKTARILVEKWDAIGQEHSDIRHQHCLRLAINELNSNGMPIRVYKLPREYTLIFDYYRNKRIKAIIEHFQKSRQYRREVGRGERLLNSSFERLADKYTGQRPSRHKRLRRNSAFFGSNSLTTQDVEPARR